jgi:hypothetical protein
VKHVQLNNFVLVADGLHANAVNNNNNGIIIILCHLCHCCFLDSTHNEIVVRCNFIIVLLNNTVCHPDKIAINTVDDVLLVSLRGSIHENIGVDAAGSMISIMIQR